MITPFGKMDGLYFDDSMEPDDEVFALRNAIEKIAEQKDVSFVRLNFETKEDFYQAMNAFRHFANDNIKAYTTSKDDDYTLIVHDEISL